MIFVEVVAPPHAPVPVWSCVCCVPFGFVWWVVFFNEINQRIIQTNAVSDPVLLSFACKRWKIRQPLSVQKTMDRQSVVVIPE